MHVLMHEALGRFHPVSKLSHSHLWSNPAHGSWSKLTIDLGALHTYDAGWREDYGNDEDGQSGACWIGKSSPAVWFFAAPALLCLLVNMIICIRIGRAVKDITGETWLE
jgi:hypothetical protein